MGRAAILRASGALPRMLPGMLLGAAVAAAALGGAPATATADPVAVADPLERPALARRAPERAVLLDAALAGTRLVAVGERGLILLSDDAGRTWRRQLDGGTAARLALEAAAALGASDPAATRALRAAELLVADGPDKPFLTLHFLDESRGFVAGAFGLIFRTLDGGGHWTPWMGRVENPGGHHLYAIRSDGRTLYLAGEQGLFLASTDGGERFAPVPVPYEGTFFSLDAGPDGRVAVGGLRGNVFVSDRGGASWRRIDDLPDASVNALRWLPDGRLLVANQAGRLFLASVNGTAARPLPVPPSPPIAGATPDGGGGLVTVGMAGPGRVDAGMLAKAGRAAP